MNDGEVVLRCGACGFDFVWTIGEQQYFKDHGLRAPKTCPPCRRLRKERLNASSPNDTEAPRLDHDR